MKRFQGQILSGAPRIAVIAFDALGNYVVATPLLQMLRRKYRPKRIDLYSGARTEELWSVDPNIDAGFRVFGASPREVAVMALERGPYDLVVNLEASSWACALAALLCDECSYVVGPCLGPDGRRDLAFAPDPVGKLAADRDWTAPDLLDRHPLLCTPFIGEIFCRLAYLDGSVPAYSVPSSVPAIEIPPMLIGVSASLEEKLWPLERWEAALSHFKKLGVPVGLLGAPPSAQRQFWLGESIEHVLVQKDLVLDFRGRLSLPEVVGAIGQAKAVLTIDNGILHLAASTKTSTVGLFRNGIHRLWAPPTENVKVLAPLPGDAVASIKVEEVLEALCYAF
jgi:ADP-heptose:LPS heptosyltransferase